VVMANRLSKAAAKAFYPFLDSRMNGRAARTKLGSRWVARYRL
jgi:hypothetical protein